MKYKFGTFVKVVPTNISVFAGSEGVVMDFSRIDGYTVRFAYGKERCFSEEALISIRKLKKTIL